MSNSEMLDFCHLFSTDMFVNVAENDESEFRAINYDSGNCCNQFVSTLILMKVIF